jgi:hypothetical protein
MDYFEILIEDLGKIEEEKSRINSSIEEIKNKNKVQVLRCKYDIFTSLENIIYKEVKKTFVNRNYLFVFREQKDIKSTISKYRLMRKIDKFCSSLKVDFAEHYREFVIEIFTLQKILFISVLKPENLKSTFEVRLNELHLFKKE